MLNDSHRYLDRRDYHLSNLGNYSVRWTLNALTRQAILPESGNVSTREHAKSNKNQGNQTKTPTLHTDLLEGD
jgi:hypothetical protein